MQNSQQRQSSKKQSLIQLKQISKAKQGQQATREAVQVLKRKLPQQYHNPIMCYLFQQQIFYQTNRNLMKVAKIFRNLNSPNRSLKAIYQLQQFLNKSPSLLPQQLDILLYNLSHLYQTNKMDLKSSKIKLSTQNIQHIFAQLQAKLYLKNHKISSLYNLQKNTHKMKIVNRFFNISNILSNLQWFQSQNSCTLPQLYNIAISLKKANKFTASTHFFKKVISQLDNQHQISILSKLNLAQCQFILGKISKAINILNNIINSQLFYIKPYRQQLQIKKNIWSHSNHIFQINTNFTNQLIKQIKYQISYHLLNNHHQSIISSSKSFFKNSQLIFINQKNNQLNQILQRKSANDVQNYQKYNLNKNNPKNISNFLMIYKSPKKKPNTFRKNISQKSTQPSSSNNSSMPFNQQLDKKKINKRNRLQSLKTFTITSNLSSQLISRKTINQTNQNLSQSSSSLSSQLNSAQQTKIQNILSTIKNSNDQNQIAQKYLNLGDIYHNQNDTENALSMYKQALFKGRYQAYGKIGNILYSMGKSSAIQHFENHLRFFGNLDRQIQLKLLHCYSKQPQYYKKASDRLIQLIHQQPCNKQVHILYVTILMKQGHIQKSIQLCQQYKKKNYISHQNHHILGLLYKSINKTKQAFHNFITALRVNPTHTDSLVQLTQLTSISHFYPQLIDIYRKAFQINPHNHQVLQILSLLCKENPINFKKLKKKLNFSQLVTYGDYFIQKLMLQQAQSTYKQALQYTNNSLIKQKLGNLQYLKKNYILAQKYYRESQKRKPIIQIQIKLGYTLIKQNRYKQAKQLLQQCIISQKQNKSFYLNILGQCQYGMNNYQYAINKFEQSSHLGYNKIDNYFWINLCKDKIKEISHNNHQYQLSKKMV